MKTITLTIALLAAISLTSCKNETKQQDESVTPEASADMAIVDVTFGVRGNCGSCKATIEKAANEVEGVTSAEWNVDTKSIMVSFDENKTDELKIHQAIAASGYDTDQVEANNDAYNNLKACCQYSDSMEMNQTKK